MTVSKIEIGALYETTTYVATYRDAVRTHERVALTSSVLSMQIILPIETTCLLVDVLPSRPLPDWVKVLTRYGLVWVELRYLSFVNLHSS